jgi:hemerythrin superfamily protein
MSQKNTLLVIGLITLFTASVNAAETQKDVIISIEERARYLAEQKGKIETLLEELKKKPNPSVEDCLKIGRYARQLAQLQKDAAQLKAGISN